MSRRLHLLLPFLWVLLTTVAGGTELPPFFLASKTDKGMHRVVGAKGRRAVIVDHQGKTRVLDEKATFNLLPDDGLYVDGQIDFSKSSFAVYVSTQGASEIPEHSFFDTLVQADRDLENVFVAVFVYPRREGLTAHRPMWFWTRTAEVGKLAAGRSKRITIKFPPAAGYKNLNWCAAAFVGGRQIRSTGGFEENIPIHLPR
jgi:hypothetical protein